MDKIESAHWSDVFSHDEHTVIHSGERYTEAVMQFSEPGLAAGSSHVIATPELTLTRFTIDPQRLLQLKDPDVSESAESVFILKGNVESRFSSFKNPVTFGRQNHSIQYNTSFAGNHIIQPGGFSALTITYNLGYLKSVLQSAASKQLDGIAESIERKQNFLAHPGNLDWSPRIAEVIHTITNCSFQGLTRYLFIESKMMELFALQIEHLNAVQTAKDEWSIGDREKLYAVRNYIDQHYLDELSLKELTQRFALNEYKLKKGFKHFFQNTVFGYILQLRMQKAKALLEKKEMNITEVAYFIGYHNVGSFSTEFKKRLGYTPNRILTGS
ncbi:helix-turn-helix transcriptional regulator [Polluticoccus soli]|uniref:helix-turn-helix transcriptional regulator n=1 Tax=Polluticoccus soli TaxID=3034150 RepID=UPI0023E30B10|nr:AraC family transcriptional regulator [Flavipsychrobacter sp. JY13-12]